MTIQCIGGRFSRDRATEGDEGCLGLRKPRPLGFANPSTRRGIADVDLFASLDADCLAKLQRISLRRSFADGQIIHVQDDEARFLNVVSSGHVRLSYMMEDGSTVLHDIVPSHAIFGEFSVLDQSTYPDIASAIGRVALVSFPSVALFDLARAQPSLARALSGAVALRSRAYIDLVRDLSLPSLSARLARALIRLADRLNASTEHGGRPVQVVGAIVTQTDLGVMARGSRGNVNRVLQAWQRAGWIALKERTIVVLNRSALVAVAADERD